MSPSDVNVSLGIYCSLSIVKIWVFFYLCLITFWKRKAMFLSIANVLFMNGVLLELDNEQTKKTYWGQRFSFVISNLVDNDTALLLLEERMAEFSSKKLSFFQNNKYSNKFWRLYEDLLCLGVSNPNVEKVVQIALEVCLCHCEYVIKCPYLTWMQLRFFKNHLQPFWNAFQNAKICCNISLFNVEKPWQGAKH